MFLAAVKHVDLWWRTKRGHRSAVLQSHLFSMFCGNDGLPRCLWAKMLPLDFGCTVRCASRVYHCPAVQVAQF